MIQAVQTKDRQSQEQKKARILAALKRMIEEVEDGSFYGEFGVTFSAQNGQIGHYEEVIRRTFK